jgi:hypothetical protein
MESYESAIQSIMRERRVDEQTAGLIVAEVYPALVAFDRDAEPDLAFDDFDSVDVGVVYTPPAKPGRVVPVDEDRSPAGSLLAQAERLAAKRNGDRYRKMSKGTSMHTVDL